VDNPARRDGEELPCLIEFERYRIGGLPKGVATLKNVKLYALSTCGWCKKTRRFLDDHNVDYEYEYVDLLTGAEKDRVMAEVKRWNPQLSFPTVVVNDSEVVVGFREDRLREVLRL
jgi:glutaredoxin-like protein NrdH